MIDLKKMDKAELIELINALGYDSKFGMFQRDYAIRAIGGKAGTVMFIDLDNFKAMNTRLGYQAADKLVNEAFTPLTGKRDKYTVFRWFSGDEIVIFAENGIDPDDIEAVHAKIDFTGAIGYTDAAGLVRQINDLSVQVMRLKKTGQKGTILNNNEEE